MCKERLVGRVGLGYSGRVFGDLLRRTGLWDFIGDNLEFRKVGRIYLGDSIVELVIL